MYRLTSLYARDRDLMKPNSILPNVPHTSIQTNNPSKMRDLDRYNEDNHRTQPTRTEETIRYLL